MTIPVIKKHFESRRRNEGLSSATEKQNRALLHKFFEWAADHYNYRSTADPRYPNPVGAIKRPTTKASVIRYLEIPDITEQLKVLKDHPQLKVMIAVCIYAGLRREEVVWLVCDDIDLKRRLISVRAKSIHGEYWQPKTKKNRAILLDGGSYKYVIHNDGVGEVKRNLPYLIFHHAVNRKAQSAIREGRYKLVKTWKGNKLELFDLSKDISEESDLSKKMPEKTKELHGKLVEFLTKVDAETRHTKKK